MEKELLGFQTITKKVAQNIHEYLYSSIKLGDQEKATLIAGILIALENESFRNTYRGMTDEDQFVDSFMSAVRYSILKYDGLKNGKEEVISVFDYIKHNSNFKSTVEQNKQRYIALQFLTEIIHKSVYTIAKTHPTYDILGEFYNEFTRYSGADQQSLGIVLTPHHIAEFMSELLEVNDEDVILDTCIGSASLALTAENSNIKENKVVGVEFNARMLSLAVANTMIRNIPTYLMLGDSWNPEIIEKIGTQKPTKLIINPPYSQDGYPELGFVKRGLDSLQPNGLGVVILPVGAVVKNSNINLSLKKEILEKHNLKAVFNMPENLFYPVSTYTVILFFESHKKNTGKTFFGNLKKDGLETVKNQGRKDINNKWLGIKKDILNRLREGVEESNISILKEIEFDSEWSFDTYNQNKNSFNSKNFIKSLRNYIIFKDGLFKKEAKENLIDYILDFLEDNPEIKNSFSNNDIKIEKTEEFKFETVFNMIRGRGGKATDAKNNPGNNFYIGASGENNGITQYTSLDTTEKGNAITVANNGSVGASFYQENDFLASSDVTVVTLKNKELNPFIALFLTTLIKQVGESFDYGRKWGITRMKESKISLPVDSNGNPDWQLMEDYIKSLPYSKYL